MILNNSFNLRSLAAILVRHLGFQNYMLTEVCVMYTMYHKDPKQVAMHQNESFWMINGLIIGILRIWIMLISIPDTTINRWKAYCSSFLNQTIYAANYYGLFSKNIIKSMHNKIRCFYVNVFIKHSYIKIPQKIIILCDFTRLEIHNILKQSHSYFLEFVK